MQINKTFLRQEREKRAWSQSHLAEVADLSMRTVQRIEQSGVASMESAKALAAALDLELAVLMENPTNPIKPHWFNHPRRWASLSVLLMGIAAVGWLSSAAAEQVTVIMSIKSPSGKHSNMHLLNEVGEESEVRLDNQLRVLVTSNRHGEHMLLSMKVYEFVDGKDQLISSPSALIEDDKPASIHIDSPANGKIHLLLLADY